MNTVNALNTAACTPITRGMHPKHQGQGQDRRHGGHAQNFSAPADGAMLPPIANQ